MAEQPVFWLGGKPGDPNKPKAPEAESYEAALRETCEACGYDVDEYVAALGNFGGWLAHLERDRVRYRLFWNGKQQELAFDKALSHGGWETLASLAVEDTGVAGFAIASRDLLNGQADGEANNDS